MMKKLILPLILFATVIGCSPAEEETADNGTPPPPKFEGKLDKTLVGSWESPDGSQMLDITDAGKAHMSGYVNTPKGKQPIDEKMDWLADGDKVLFKMTSGDIQKYKFAIDGENLELKTAKTTSKYKKKK